MNDQVPTFEKLLYETTVSEAVGIGTSILAVSATDRDTGRNAEVTYHIGPVTPTSNDSAYFHIDPDHGVVLTKLKVQELLS